MSHPQWHTAMQHKIATLESNWTWTVNSLPPGEQALNCKWVYWIKRKTDGAVEIYKAWLVFLVIPKPKVLI